MVHWKAQLACVLVAVAALVASVGGFETVGSGFYW